MSDLKLSDAFAEYGANLKNPQWAVSALAKDGALVMSCWFHYIKINDGVWRYEDTLSRWSGNTAGNNLCKQHIEDAFKNNRPVRIVIARTEDTATVDSESTSGSRAHQGQVLRFDITIPISLPR